MSDQTFVRWNDAESKFVPTTADDPRRVLVKADKEDGFFKWLVLTGVGALVGAWIVDQVKK